MTQIVLDSEAFKALSSDTRLQILKALDARPLTVSEMGRLLQLNKATVFEHLKQLSLADLVKKVESEGRKWVYYKLTWKGRNVVHPENVQFMLMLATSVLSVGGLVASLGNVLQWWGGSGPVGDRGEKLAPSAPSPSSSPEQQQSAANQGTADEAAKSTPPAAPVADEPTSAAPDEAWYQNYNVWLLIALGIVVLLSAYFAWRLWRERQEERGALLQRLQKLPPEPAEPDVA